MNTDIITDPDGSSARTQTGSRELLTQPAYQIRKHEHGLSLVVALPGVARDKLDVSTERETVTVTGHRDYSIPEEWKCHRRPSSPSGYRLVLRLHPGLDPSSTSARLENGLLTLEIRLHQSALPRQIEVN